MLVSFLSIIFIFNELLGIEKRSYVTLFYRHIFVCVKLLPTHNGFFFILNLKSYFLSQIDNEINKLITNKCWVIFIYLKYLFYIVNKNKLTAV